MSWKNEKAKVSDAKPGIKVGTLVAFHRKNKEFKGVIDTIRENSVIVKVDSEVQSYLDIENELTVVNHNQKEWLENAN